METEERNLSVLMLPWLAHGHISPYLELAKRLTKRNFQIYLCSTPINLSSIKKRVTEQYSLSIQLIEIQIPSLPELPPHLHTTNGLPIHLNLTLKKAFAMASPTFSDILKNLKPDLVIYDFNQPWAPLAAASLGIPAVEFIPASAAMISYGFHVFRKPNIEFPYPEMNLQGRYWNKKFQEMIASNQNDSKDRDNNGNLKALRASCDILLMKTLREIEGKFIDYGSVLIEKRIVSTGPLVQEPEDGDQNSQIMEWLDKKEKSSTVLVSFGTEYFLSRDEREEIAHGLEQSMVNFIWVLRFPDGEKIRIEESLPEGFFEKVGERGLVVEAWAPQARILAHPSTGGFVSHCGWGSIMESMGFGIPIVAIPMHLDQPFNARLVVEVGVGVEVKRDDNGRLNRAEIAQLIKEVVVEENGQKIREKAIEIRETIKTKGEEEIDGVVEEFIRLSRKKKFS